MAPKVNPRVKKSTKRREPPTDVNRPLAKDSLEPASGHELTVSAWTMSMPQGIYCFRVRDAAPSHSDDNLTLPAVQISPGPGIARGVVEFTQGGSMAGGWLYASGDTVIVNVTAASAPILITSVRSPGGSALAIEVDRLSGGAEVPAPVPSAVPRTALQPHAPRPGPAAKFASVRGLSIRTTLHIRNRGDVIFEDTEWAGRIGRGFAIEALSITPLEKLGASDIQYKALTATGFETPWISDGAACGTTGMAIPLVGFAIRLKSEHVKNYDVEYSGCFLSGKIVGPLHNGAPCRSPEANDVLEGIQLIINKRARAKPTPRSSGQHTKASIVENANPQRSSFAKKAIRKIVGNAVAKPPTKKIPAKRTGGSRS